jgi:ankyrin repeat protein
VRWRGGRARPEVRDRGGRTSLFYAVVDGKDDEVTRLIAAGADVDAEDLDGWRPAHAAGMHQRPRALRELLAAGAMVDPTDSRGNTPLFYATTFSKGAGACIQLLLAAGADRHSRNHCGHSPLEAAQRIANFPLLQWYEPAVRPVDPDQLQEPARVHVVTTTPRGDPELSVGFVDEVGDVPE